MEVKIDNVETIRLFGSYARGEQTDSSDYDILVVLNQSQIVTECMENNIQSLFNRDISISWYSKQRIEHLYGMGHLFAWHLYLESKELTTKSDFISQLAAPKEYSYSYEDVWSLLEILYPVRNAIENHPKNVIYEMGIAYVCARNIAICALPKLKKKYSFSVNAPFELNLPISITDFEMLKKCRDANTRGTQPPQINLPYSINLCENIYSWGKHLLTQLK